MKKISYLFLSDSVEDIEAIAVVDILRRAHIPIQTVSMNSTLEVISSHGICIKADTLFDKEMFHDADYLILPGGSTKLNEYDHLKELLKEHYERGGGIAAICAAPMVLGGIGLLNGKRATCFPGFEESLSGAIFVDEPVVVDGSTITANGPAAALKFAYTLVEQICSKERVEIIKKQMMFK